MRGRAVEWKYLTWAVFYFSLGLSLFRQIFSQVKSSYFNRNTSDWKFLVREKDFPKQILKQKVASVWRDAAQDARLERSATAKKCSTSCLHKQWDVIMHSLWTAPFELGFQTKRNNWACIDATVRFALNGGLNGGLKIIYLKIISLVPSIMTFLCISALLLS